MHQSTTEKQQCDASGFNTLNFLGEDQQCDASGLNASNLRGEEQQCDASGFDAWHFRREEQQCDASGFDALHFREVDTPSGKIEEVSALNIGELIETPQFFIAGIPVYGDLILSPMDGFSDLPFRSLCREMGSALSYTAFINALDVLQNHPDINQKTAYLESERPVVFQIFDNHPERMLQAAKILQDKSPDVIDINMGCSVHRVSGRGAGAGLLRQPIMIARMIRKLRRELRVPVTAKIRLGWDETSRNYRLVARVIEESGGALIAVHGRTKHQGYGGSADWDAIAEIKQAVSIPVIGNGDVNCVADIERLKVHTACDGIMIGRAAIGNPWIFSRLDRDQVDPIIVRQTMADHLHRMLDFYSEDKGLLNFRKHAVRYLQLERIDRSERTNLFQIENPSRLLESMYELV